MNKILSYFSKFKKDSYAICGHPMESEDEYTKDLYITMLCVVSQYGKASKVENKSILIERIIKGLKSEKSIKYFNKKALEVNEGLVSEFIKIFREKNVKYNFILDIMILMNLDGLGMDEELVLIAEISEALGLNKEDIKLLSKIVKSILEQNNEAYSQLLKEKNERIDFTKFHCYTKEYVIGRIGDTKELVYYYAKDKSAIELKKDKSSCAKFTQTEVIFENLKIDLTGTKLKFKSQEKISFINCEITGGKHNIKVYSCKEMIFDKCTISGFDGCGILGTDSYDEVDKFVMKNSKLENCSAKERTVIGKASVIEFKDVRFKNLNTRGIYYPSVIIIETKTDSIVERCKFHNCKGDGWSSEEKLFNNNNNFQECELIDSDSYI
ncbi:MAG: right-handed parallel beta-helix repeat-containing protein [Clostridium sp.]